MSYPLPPPGRSLLLASRSLYPVSFATKYHILLWAETSFLGVRREPSRLPSSREIEDWYLPVPLAGPNVAVDFPFHGGSGHRCRTAAHTQAQLIMARSTVVAGHLALYCPWRMVHQNFNCPVSFSTPTSGRPGFNVPDLVPSKKPCQAAALAVSFINIHQKPFPGPLYPPPGAV